ncbi:glycosyltransferase [Bacillus infantis]|uniref:glycosyltransferase family 4 protein n=1 Tax=Bacillus infantis TaxID=324767 RepID=UPI00101D8E16|nr:glycosyltransferase family 4 protein [Bacillus infantis]RYI28772.1 glycosyltransferase [Bacillus infantis]
MKIIISHPGTQHSQKVHGALMRRYDSTLYTRLFIKSEKIINLLSKSPKLKRLLKNRFNKELANVETLYTVSEVILIIMNQLKLFKIREFYHFYSQLKFGTKVAKKVEDGSVFYGFDTSSLKAFEYLNKNKKCIKILDVSNPNFLLDDSKFERSYIEKKKMLVARKELELADYIIVASSYSKMLVANAGISEERIFLVPYGFSQFSERNYLESLDDKRNTVLNLLYVGNVSRLKGIDFLFEALNDIAHIDFQLTIVGNITPSFQDFIKGFTPKFRYSLVGYSRNVEQYYKNCDLFIFPTMSDGFGQVILEAISYGALVASSVNSVAPDLIIDHKNGYLFEYGDKEKLQRIIKEVILNKNDNRELTIQAINALKNYTVENYHANINSVIEQMISVKSH